MATVEQKSKTKGPQPDPTHHWASLAQAVKEADLNERSFSERCGFTVRAYRDMLHGEYGCTIERVRLMAEVLTGAERDTPKHARMCQRLFAGAPRGDRRMTRAHS